MFTALVRLIGFRAARVLCFALFALVCDPAVRAQIGSSGIDSDPASGMTELRLGVPASIRIRPRE